MQNIDSFSYLCGAINGVNVMVAAGIKSLALTFPMDTKPERDMLLDFARENCYKFGTKFYSEDEPLITDLFPLSKVRDKYYILLYRADHVIDEYIRLKNRKESLVTSGAYFGGNRNQVAWAYGRLLSYPQDTIQQLLAENNERETL